ncbi:MAG: Regulatory protein MerR [Candidatus Tokpelaia sp. JSC189]|nr:MAG: Regulatory protein MerR [Candidatus Tokpelaia sp. JSC189]
MDKSPDAFRTISEVADMLNMPQHVLRFWETRFSQIKPMKRAGGRRYYRPADVDFLKGIKHLLYDKGYTIKGAQKLLKEKGNSFVVALGIGDVMTTEATVSKKQLQQHDDLFPEDILPSQNQNMDGREFFGLLKVEKNKAVEVKKLILSKEGVILLQKILLDLMECKRLLDDVRTR